MGHIVRSKTIPSMIGEVTKVYPNGNYRVKIGYDHYVYCHKDCWEVVL